MIDRLLWVLIYNSYEWVLLFVTDMKHIMLGDHCLVWNFDEYIYLVAYLIRILQQKELNMPSKYIFKGHEFRAILDFWTQRAITRISNTKLVSTEIPNTVNNIRRNQLKSMFLVNSSYTTYQVMKNLFAVLLSVVH